MNKTAEHPPGKRRRRIAVIAIVCCVLLIAFHQQILTTIGEVMVHADPSAPGADVLVIGGDGASREALLWLAKHDQAKLLLADKPAPRVVQIGATQTDAQRRRALSKKAGIAEDRIEVIVGESMRGIRPVQCASKWLTANPNRRLRVLCSQFSSFGLRRSIDRHLRPSISGRISIHPLVDRRYSTHDWWTSRQGSRALFRAYLGQIRSLLGLYSPEPPRYLTPAEYEQAFLSSLPGVQTGGLPNPQDDQ